MTPQELQKRIDALEQKIMNMEMSSSFPRNIEMAISERLGGIMKSSTNSASGHNKVVNEAGVATYSVLNTPDGFDTVMIGGVAHYLPYWTT